jgi:hypothetical protein
MIIRIHRLAQMQVEYDNNENFTKFLNNIAQANKTTEFTVMQRLKVYNHILYITIVFPF